MWSIAKFFKRHSNVEDEGEGDEGEALKVLIIAPLMFYNPISNFGFLLSAFFYFQDIQTKVFKSNICFPKYKSQRAFLTMTTLIPPPLTPNPVIHNRRLIWLEGDRGVDESGVCSSPPFIASLAGGGIHPGGPRKSVHGHSAFPPPLNSAMWYDIFLTGALVRT